MDTHKTSLIVTPEALDTKQLLAVISLKLTPDAL